MNKFASKLNLFPATFVAIALLASLHATATNKTNAKDGAEMIGVPAGVFTMGTDTGGRNDEKPAHRVTLDGYWIYKNLVTVAQYRTFCNATGHAMAPAPTWGLQDDHPIVNVSWSDANAYCAWAGTRLPTEAEWEMAASGGDGRTFPWGNEFSARNLRCSSPETVDAGSTAPVGTFPTGASPYGCLDMAGNAWEWCADYYKADYYKEAPAKNPMGPRSAGTRVVRGGSWYDNEAYIFRCSNRSSVPPRVTGYGIGFRCVQGQ